MKSVWGAHVRLPEECICERPMACRCCPRPCEEVERDILSAYQCSKTPEEREENPVEDHLPDSIHKGASNLHSDSDLEDKIKDHDPRVQKLGRTYLEVFGELPPPASCERLVQMDLKLKPEFQGHKTRRRPYLAAKDQLDEIDLQTQECVMPA